MRANVGVRCRAPTQAFIMRSSRRLIALALSIAVAAPSVVGFTSRPAWAQANKKVPTIREQLPPEARGHWEAGLALAQRKIWDGARSSFKAAYDLSKNPRVLYNLAITEKELGRFAAALEWFERELAEGEGKLSPEEERDVKSAIADLQNFVAELTIEVSEPGADVFIDGERVDPERLKGPITVQLGERHVRAVKPGFAEAVGAIQLAGRGKGTVTLKLQPLVKTERVNVSVVGPPSAVVKIDGKEVGVAPYSGRVTISAEPHQFSAEAPGFVTATQSIVVSEGSPLNLTLHLAPEQALGRLVVVAKPEGATIEIDGKTVGATRWDGPVDARVHQIVVKKPGYYTWTYDVDVPKGGERAVTASLNEDRNTSFVPWLIGSIVVGTAITVGIALLATPPDEKLVDGTLPPFKVGTNRLPGFSF